MVGEGRHAAQRTVVVEIQVFLHPRIPHHLVELIAEHEVALYRECVQLLERLMIEFPRFLKMAAVELVENLNSHVQPRSPVAAGSSVTPPPTDVRIRVPKVPAE